MQKLIVALFVLLLHPSAIAAQLIESDIVKTKHDGQIIKGLRIKAVGKNAIEVIGHSNVVIRNVEIEHDGAHGIYCVDAPGLRIENVNIKHTGLGLPNHAEQNNVNCIRSDDLTINRVRLRGGSSGVYIVSSNRPKVRYVEGYNQRGPYPRGQLIQFNNSPNCLLEDFSAANEDGGMWTEDNVSIYRSENCVVRRGLLDGNNSPTGVGVMFENVSSGLVEDVDTIRQGNGSFSAWTSQNVIFRRTRARENICADQGRGKPSSGAQIWVGGGGSMNLRIEGSKYWERCSPHHLIWRSSAFDRVELEAAEFVLRRPLSLQFPWE